MTATAMQISFLPLELPWLLPLGTRTSSTSSFLPQEPLPLLILPILDEIPCYLRHSGSPQPILRMINEICPVSRVIKWSRSWMRRSTLANRVVKQEQICRGEQLMMKTFWPHGKCQGTYFRLALAQSKAEFS